MSATPPVSSWSAKLGIEWNMRKLEEKKIKHDPKQTYYCFNIIMYE